MVILGMQLLGGRQKVYKIRWEKLFVLTIWKIMGSTEIGLRKISCEDVHQC
jgi:hypothetical protein